jgi:hypothetical protein
MVYAFLPVHTTNLQALNGTGHSDLFLTLEVIKKIYGAALLMIGAFVFKSPLAIAFGSLVGSLISTFVNAYPNRTVVGYSFGEQVRDYAPAFVLAAIAGAASWSMQLLGMSDLVTLLAQIVVMIVVYLGIAWITHVEEFDYLLRNARSLIASRLGR